MGVLKEVRVRGYGQDRDIKVWIEKSGFLNNKRKVYSTFWGSNTKKYEENKKLYDWDPIEFNPSDLDEASGFGDYKKYYDDWIRERDQPNTGFKAYNNFQRNGLEFSSDYNTDLDIIKLYILINTEKYKDTVYEWSLIQDPIVGAKGGDAPYYRNFGFDSYYLNNGAKIRIAWLEGSYTKGSVSWSNEKGKELLDQDLTRYNTNYLSKEDKAGYSKAMDGIWAPEGNPAGDKFMDYNHNGSAPKFSKEAIYGKDRMKWGGLTDDEAILYNIVAAWKDAVSDYNDLAVLKNIYGNPAIEISDSKDKLIPYKSPFGNPPASGPTASDAAQGASASDAAAAKGATQSKFKPTIEGIADGFQIQAKVDLPSFTIYVGDPKKDWPAAGAASEDYPPEEEFDNVDGAPVEGEDEPDEYSEAPFVLPDKDQLELKDVNAGSEESNDSDLSIEKSGGSKDIPDNPTSPSAKQKKAIKDAMVASGVYYKGGGACGKYTWNIAKNYHRYLQNMSPLKSREAAGGNANQSAYYDRLEKELKYKNIARVSSATKAQIKEKLKSVSWGVGDVICYWSNDKNIKNNEPGHRRYGHTQIYVGDASVSKWSSDRGDNYGCSFVYSAKDDDWGYVIFKSPVPPAVA